MPYSLCPAQKRTEAVHFLNKIYSRVLYEEHVVKKMLRQQLYNARDLVLPSCYAVAKTDSLNFYKQHIRCDVVKTDSPDFYKPPTRIAVIKTDSSNFLQFNTRFGVVKTNFPNLYKPHTWFAVVKTDSPSFYKTHIRLEVVKTDFSILQ